MALPTHYAYGLSAAPTGQPFLIAATGHPATLVHLSSASENDFVVLWGCNNSAAAVEVTTWVTPQGVATTSGTPISTVVEIPPKKGKVVIEPGLRLSGSLELRATATQAGVIWLVGYVYRRVNPT